MSPVHRCGDFLRCRDFLLVDLYTVFKLLCNNLHLIGLYVSNQTPNFSSSNQGGNKKSSLVYKLAELFFHLETDTYIKNTYNIYCVDVYISW